MSLPSLVKSFSIFSNTSLSFVSVLSASETLPISKNSLASLCKSSAFKLLAQSGAFDSLALLCKSGAFDSLALLISWVRFRRSCLKSQIQGLTSL